MRRAFGITVVCLLLSLEGHEAACGDDKSVDYRKRTVQQLLEIVGGEHKARALAAMLTLAHGAFPKEPLRAALAKMEDGAARGRLGFVLAQKGERAGYAALLSSPVADHLWAQQFLREAGAPTEDTAKGPWRRAAKAWLTKQPDDALKKAIHGEGFGLWMHVRGPASADWRTYLLGVHVLQDVGDRDRARSLFAAVAHAFPESEHAVTAKEHADVLAAMVKEDKVWIQPKDPQALPKTERLAYLVHHLRDINHYQYMQPGGCALLGPWGRFGEERQPNPADALMAMGDEALPTLVNLLDDRRMTRSVAYWRNFHPSRKILRYQDVAVRILGHLLPFRPYRARSTGGDFSIASPDKRRAIKARVEAWIEKTRGKSQVERLWIAVAEAHIRDALKLLRALALEHGQKDRVLKRLHAFWDGERNRWYRPRTTLLMAELGDLSRVLKTIEQFKEFNPQHILDAPDGGAAALNARDEVAELEEKYGRKARDKEGAGK